jgi:hypothetical protein
MLVVPGPDNPALTEGGAVDFIVAGQGGRVGGDDFCSRRRTSALQGNDGFLFRNLAGDIDKRLPLFTSSKYMATTSM